MKPRHCIMALVLTAFYGMGSSAQVALFDFDNAPLHAALPVDQTAGGITAHLSATGDGYSIQEANVLGFTPQGFAGRIIYPNSINRADLLIRFDNVLTDFWIMYCCQELGCDDAATMRVTAYLHGSLAGTNTKTASRPGTYPVDTLRCSIAQGFDSVVIHYDSRPPTCQDYGTIFLADNMCVTASNTTGVTVELPLKTFAVGQNYPNPFNPSTTIPFVLPGRCHVTLTVLNMLGQKVAELVNGDLDAGYHEFRFNAGSLASGVYVYRLQAGSRVQTRSLILIR